MEHQDEIRDRDRESARQQLCLCPDLPGCVVTGNAPEDAEAIRFHREGIEKDVANMYLPTNIANFVSA